MGLSKEDRILIKNLYECKGYGAKRLMREFPTKEQKKTTLNDFLKHLRQNRTTAQKCGSGRPRTARTAANIDDVNDLVLRQEEAPQTHRTIRQISRETGIHRSSVERIIRHDLLLKCVKKRHAHELLEANCITRLTRAKQELRKFPGHAVDFVFFSDEKVFTVAPPVNLQNDRVYVSRSTKKREIAADRLLRTRPTFSKSLMVSVAVSKLGCTDLIFVEPGVKVDGAYYRDVLRQQMLPAI